MTFDDNFLKQKFIGNEYLNEIFPNPFIDLFKSQSIIQNKPSTRYDHLIKFNSLKPIIFLQSNNET